MKKAYKYIYERPPKNLIIDGLLDRVVFKRPHLNPCGMGSSYIVIRHDGKIASCQMTLDEPIGSIDDEDIIETMRKGCFVKPIGLTVEGKEPCRNCQWKYICCGGCPLLTYRQRGQCDVKTPYCAVYRALIPEVLRIEAKRLIMNKMIAFKKG